MKSYQEINKKPSTYGWKKVGNGENRLPTMNTGMREKGSGKAPRIKHQDIHCNQINEVIHFESLDWFKGNRNNKALRVRTML